ncbi:MAG TPA: polysaccharide deacetylase family protein [Vicinamibacterales bacterium]
MTARAMQAVIFTSLLATSLFARPFKHAASEDEAPTATVLCYHIVESPQDPRMEIGRDAFRQQMRYLSMTGYNIIPLRELYEYVSGKRASIPRNAVVITFDDGWRSTYTEVFPEMQKLGFPFTVFIYPRIIGQTSHALSWKQVKEMADAGVDIESHSFSHPFLTKRRHTTLDDRDYYQWLDHELEGSKQMIERETGHTVSFLAYPYGDYDHYLVAACARAGYAAALTCDYGRVRKASDPLRMKRFVIDKRIDFASFRRYLGAGSMRVQDITPMPNQVLEPEQPIVISAKIPNHETLDPKSIGMALITPGKSSPFSYDAQNGSISMILSDALETLKGKPLRALVWATDKAGKRLEATWVFHVPEQQLPVNPSAAQPSSLAPAGGLAVASSGAKSSPR